MKKILVGISFSIFSMVAMAEKCPSLQKEGNSPKIERLANELKNPNCELTPGLTSQSLMKVIEIIQTKKVKGGKRFETAPPDGIPTGKIYPVNGKVTFDLREISHGDFIKLIVTPDGGAELTFNQNAVLSGKIHFDKMKPDTSASWTLVTKKQTYRGEIRLPQQSILNEVRDQLLDVEKKNLSPDMKKLMRAAIFEQADFDFNRDELISEIRNEQD